MVLPVHAGVSGVLYHAYNLPSAILAGVRVSKPAPDGILLAEELLHELLIDHRYRRRTQRVSWQKSASHHYMRANRIKVLRIALDPRSAFVQVWLALHLHA